MRVSDITRPKPTAAAIDLGEGEIVNITFDRNRITPRWWADMKTHMDDSDPFTVATLLASVILSWDVTNDDGSVYPPTAENLGVFSTPDLQTLLSAMLEAAVPSDAEGKASSVMPSTVSSDFTLPPVTSPNGQDTSPLPVPSGSPSLT